MKEYLSLFKRTPFFTAMSDEEILSILQCMQAAVRPCPKGSYLLRAGNTTDSMGILLSGSALILQEDVWGHRHIMDLLSPGDSFGEVFAASRGSLLNVSVVAKTECRILLLQIDRILSACPNTCAHHTRLIRNLVQVIAAKALRMQNKVNHISKRSTREKLMSYLSAEAEQNGSLTFTIPYNRQQLADYLCVERAAMSVELSRLQKDGILRYHKNEFTLSPDAADS